LLLLSVFFISLSSQASTRFAEWRVTTKEEVFGLDLETPFTSISLHGRELWDGISVLVNGVEYFPEVSAHMGAKSSALILGDEPFNMVRLINHTGKEIDITVKSYNGQYTTALKQKAQQVQAVNKRSDCDLPPIVDQDIWRDGLKDPKPNPAATEVTNLVIHHSATSNSATDYLLAVRNIYLYHVNNNGWDDVGYNFLVAPDGTLYAGRDGQGKEDDNVRGAHFCAKNSYTMGVCLIGNYSEIPPPDTMINTLAALLAWKLKKDDLQPLEKTFHPKGSSTGFDLPVVCGHRDGHKPGLWAGCQTECPGNYTYDIMDSIRARVVDVLLDCDYVVGMDSRIADSKLQIQNWEGGLLITTKENTTIQVFDMLGREQRVMNLVKGVSSKVFLSPGVYVLRAGGGSGIMCLVE